LNWKSWQTGRPAPIVTIDLLNGVMQAYPNLDGACEEWSRTEKKSSISPGFLRLVGVSSISIVVGLNNNPPRTICGTRHETGAARLDVNTQSHG